MFFSAAVFPSHTDGVKASAQSNREVRIWPEIIYNINYQLSRSYDWKSFALSQMLGHILLHQEKQQQLE